MKWEYKVIDFNQAYYINPKILVDAINEIGEHGWEIVAVVEGSGMHYIYFKRPWIIEVVEKPNDQPQLPLSSSKS